jgi:hypothetical protein
MVLRPFFGFYGGKWRIAPTYPAPEHDDVIEPFAGAAGYATRHHERRVLLVEKDETIAALWSWLVRVSAAEVLRIPLVGAGETVDDLRGVAPEARSLVGFWLNRAPSAPRKSPSAWMRGGLRPGCFWGEKVRARIAQQVDAIRHWKVLHGSYESAPDVLATWFVDPPYIVGGGHYRTGRPDFAAVADFARSRRGLTIVCEQEGAAWLPFEPHVVAKANESKHGGKTSREVMFVQRTGTAARGQLGLFGAAT